MFHYFTVLSDTVGTVVMNVDSVSVLSKLSLCLVSVKSLAASDCVF
jgi:hypothetical protein